MKKRVYEFPPQLFDYFSKVGYFPDGDNHQIQPKIKKVKENARNSESN